MLVAIKRYQLIGYKAGVNQIVRNTRPDSYFFEVYLARLARLSRLSALNNARL